MVRLHIKYMHDRGQFFTSNIYVNNAQFIFSYLHQIVIHKNLKIQKIIHYENYPLSTEMRESTNEKIQVLKITHPTHLPILPKQRNPKGQVKRERRR